MRGWYFGVRNWHLVHEINSNEFLIFYEETGLHSTIFIYFFLNGIEPHYAQTHNGKNKTVDYV